MHLINPRLFFSFALLLFFIRAISSAKATVSSCTLQTALPFGRFSTLYQKYSYRYDNSADTASLPVVADVTGDLYPEIFFVTGNPAHLVAIHLVSGLSFQQLWKQTALQGTHVAVAKIPNTSNWLLCALENLTTLTCFDPVTGTKSFSQSITLPSGTFGQYSAVAIESLFQNDPNNIFILAPNRVFKYNSTAGVSLYCDIIVPTIGFQLPFAVDIDLDGISEIFYSDCVFKATDCSKIWCGSFSSNPPDRGVASAVANMDADPEGEVVMCGFGKLAVFEHNGSLKWSNPLSGHGGPPTIADFDGDGTPDVAVMSLSDHSVFNGKDGTMLYRFSSTQSPSTSLSSFDFQGDGKSEIVDSEGTAVYILSSTFTLKTTLGAYTLTENPVIADIDLDGMADILVVGNDGLNILKSQDAWMGSKSFWNQHGFNDLNHDDQYYPQVTNVSSSFRSTPATRFFILFNHQLLSSVDNKMVKH